MSLLEKNPKKHLSDSCTNETDSFVVELPVCSNEGLTLNIAEHKDGQPMHV